MPFFEELARKYADRDLQVFNIYVREPHAGERGFSGYRDHESYGHKVGYAQELAREKNLKSTILVDGMDQKVHATLGDLPNILYLIGKDGRVAYKASWSDAEFVDEYMADLVNKDPAFAGKPRKDHPIFTAAASTQI